MDETAAGASARILWDYHRLDQEIGEADVIVGLGSYDLRVADRVAELFLSGCAARVIFTGHSGHWTEGRYAGSEAAAFAGRAIGRGVPEDAIALEERARNIGENVAFSAELIAACARVVFVTKPQTQRRCWATVLRQWREVAEGDAAGRLRVTAPATLFEDQPTPDYPLRRLIEEMVGDLWRILEYPKLGFQVPQAVPDDVLDAYGRLCAAGYDGHIPR